MYLGNILLLPFCTNEWFFTKNNLMQIENFSKVLNNSPFIINYSEPLETSMKNTIIATKKFLLKEELDWETDRKRMRRFVLKKKAKSIFIFLCFQDENPPSFFDIPLEIRSALYCGHQIRCNRIVLAIY